MRWPGDPVQVRAQLQAVISEYHNQFEAERWVCQTLTPEGLALDVYIQSSFGGYPMLDDFDPSTFIKAANIFGIGLAILDGKSPRECGNLGYAESVVSI